MAMVSQLKNRLSHAANRPVWGVSVNRVVSIVEKVATHLQYTLTSIIPQILLVY